MCQDYLQVHNIPVISWLESMTRLESRYLVTRTRLKSRWEKWWFDSTGVTFFTEWLDSSRNSSQSHFHKISEPVLHNPVRLHTKKWPLFASVMIKIEANILFCMSSRAICYILSPPRGRLETLLSLRGQQGTIYWHLIVVWHSICISWSWQWASYCNFESFPDTSKVT